MTAPPPKLADAVNTFFIARVEAGATEEHMPAYSAQAMVFVSGAMVMRPGSATEERLEGVVCTAPLLSAAPITIEGPALVVGASLTPLGWQGLAKLPADTVNDRAVPAEEVFTPERLEALYEGSEQCRRSVISPDELREILAQAVGDRRHAIRPDHAAFVQKATRWLASDLNPRVDKLYAEAGVSVRTAQRLCRRFFGVAPAQLAKRYRAIRAAMLLANPHLPQAMQEAIRDAYFDQAHLIRDIRRYTGRTPTRLADGESLIDGTLDPQAHGAGARILREKEV